ncbi:class I adenylate-forming enzyme family protein [Alkalihalobacterium elongatum]|uniref:class I adenylate-forming enzyme family protein n=1 Tax=Alkalihalobacterium elongatum TaxID=2675466 RepID=UPI001C1F690F|nr:long-chain fatty acid--CoA ligase [Alkalihalobacterium elongatum]
MSTIELLSSRQQLVGGLLKKAAHQTPSKEAFIYEDTRITYQVLYDRATKAGHWLRSKGLEQDDKVGFILKNGLPFVEIFFATTLSGAVGVPINFRLKQNEIEYILQNSECKFLFIDKEYVEVIEDIQEKLVDLQAVIVIDETELPLGMISYDEIFTCEEEFPPVDINENDGCMIVYTSGTTGRPKGAVLTHKNLYQNGMNMIWEFKLDTSFKFLLVPPLFHVGSMSFLIHTCLVKGTSVIHRDFHPEAVLEAIEKEQINSLFLVPAMWNFLLQVPNINDYQLSSLRKCMTAAAICPLELKKSMMHHFPHASIYDVFGQTEMSPCTTCLHPEDSLRKTTSVGKPVINVEVRVVDDQMNDVPIGEIGEIVYRGPTLMKEYYKNREATEEAFAGGWFHSGDLVRMDDEGFIYVVDRKKDMIISGGENIYPAEIEEVLYTHPKILEVAVIGVPDKDWGENVKAVIVTKRNETMTEQEVIDFCSKYLASYKKPKSVEFMLELPRNAAGKVLKTALRND